MRKLILMLAAAGLVGSIAFAGSDCTHTQSGCVVAPGTNVTQTQNINVTVPSVLKLVIDNPSTIDWTVDLTAGATPAPSNCYVIPYWVGPNQSMTIGDFLTAASANGGDFSNLVPWKSSYGYPPVIANGAGQVLTWSQVAGASAAYTGGSHGSEAAKGNLFCTHSFVAEKWSNCAGAVFYASMTYNTTSLDQSGLGAMYILDTAANAGNGNSIPAVHSSFVPFPTDTNVLLVSGGATSSSTQPYNGIPVGQWINDTVTQGLFFGTSQPGSYALTATYTLGSAMVDATTPVQF